MTQIKYEPDMSIKRVEVLAASGDLFVHPDDLYEFILRIEGSGYASAIDEMEELD